MSNESADGAFTVNVKNVTQGVAGQFEKRQANVKMPEISKAFLDKIPRRVVDAEGNEGDYANFLLIGSEDKVKQVFQTAGWVLVDRAPRDAVLHGILASLSKQAYTQLPMSELMMFGRVQDYGYAHPEPFTVVAQRHHLLLWQSTYTLGGQQAWVGAATHHIGFDRDQH